MKRIAAVLIMGMIGLAPVVGTAPFAAAATDVPITVVPYSGADPTLTRAPYVTDLTQTSADVTWATAASAGSTPGTLTWGTGTNCTANSVPVPQSLPTLVPASASPPSATSRQFTVGPTSELQSTVQVSGLQAGTTYCYRIFSGGTPAVDLLGSNSSPSFTTLDPVKLSSTSPVTFDVVGDLGETNYSSGTDFADDRNTDQAAIDSLIGQSASSAGARFVVTAGDVAYSGGTETNYGDLQQTGSEVSDIFGPSYWPLTGGLPTFGVVGNHGQNVDSLRVWPESTSTADSSGTYGYASYPPVPADGVGTSTRAGRLVRHLDRQRPHLRVGRLVGGRQRRDLQPLPGGLRRALDAELARVPVAGRRSGQPPGWGQDGRLPLPPPLGQLDTGE